MITQPFILAFAGILILLGWNIFLQFQYLSLRQRLAAIFRGGKSKDLEGVLAEQIKRLRESREDIKDIREFTFYLEKMAISGLQKISVSRFNSFQDTRGNQSFSICLLDAKNSGVILSSLFTRDGNRVFAKNIINGKPEHPLIKEEEKTLKEAVKK